MNPNQNGNPNKNPMKVAIILFAIFWTFIAFTIVTAVATTTDMFVFPILIFPLFGVFFVVFAIKAGLKSNQSRGFSTPPNPPTPDDDPFADFDAKVKKEGSTVLFCPNCGDHVDLTDTYCSKCGTKIR